MSQAQPRMAEEFRAAIEDLRAIAGTPEIIVKFRDQTVISFQAVNGDPGLRGTGGNNGTAKRFYDGVQEFKFLPEGVAFVFRDDSELQLELPGSTTRTVSGPDRGTPQ